MWNIGTYIIKMCHAIELLDVCCRASCVLDEQRFIEQSIKDQPISLLKSISWADMMIPNLATRRRTNHFNDALFAEVQERNWWLADDTCLTDSGANGRGHSLFLFSPVKITSRSAWLPLSMHGYTNSSQRRLSSDRHPSISIHSARCMKPPEPDQQHNSKYKLCFLVAANMF